MRTNNNFDYGAGNNVSSCDSHSFDDLQQMGLSTLKKLNNKSVEILLIASVEEPLYL